ncbi:hypothetical protein BC826DRAFT_1042839 [Russula brevipes]|nr:hypothetical protein BC826DRAFT_1042839 [Russula brevipes]
MRFRATLAFSFLVFIVALLVSVRAEQKYPLTIREPVPDQTWIEGSSVHIVLDVHFYGIFFKYPSAGAYLRRQGMKDYPLTGFELFDESSISTPVKVPQLAEGKYDLICNYRRSRSVLALAYLIWSVVHEQGGTLLAKSVRVHLKKS